MRLFLYIFIGMERLAYKPEGYKFWSWKGRKIHYVEQGDGLPVVLIHGFGASAFHWRFLTISQPFQVMAIAYVDERGA